MLHTNSFGRAYQLGILVPGIVALIENLEECTPLPARFVGIAVVIGS